MKKLLVLLLILPAVAPAVRDMKWSDLNHWSCPFCNDGRWGIDITIGSGVAGGSWPQPLRNFYIFGGGPWVGGIVGGDTLVTMGYNPNSGFTEFGPTLCRYWREGTADSADRVYKYPGDWPPPLRRFPMAPQQPRSEMDLWCCFGDSDPQNHVALWSSDAALVGNYAYLACQTGLLVIDVSEPQHPHRAGRCDTPGYACGVAVTGDYAYVADSDSGLRVIDVSDPQSPYETGYCDTPGRAYGVAVAGSYAYVADSDSGLLVIDVSEPQHPHRAGRCDTPGYDACGVAVAGSYAYVAAGDSGLRVIDVSDPESPHEAGFCNTPSWAWDVAVAGGYAYVADLIYGLRIIDVTNPQSPYETGYYDTPGRACGVAVAGSYAYVAAGDSGLRVIDVSDPESPYETGYYDTPGRAYRVAVAGSYAYLADCGYGLRVVRVSDPQSPYEVGYLALPGRPLGIDVCLATYGFSDSIARDLLILKYELANRSGSALGGVYFGVVLDGDVGVHRDDMTGLILNKLFENGSDTLRVKDFGFMFDHDNVEDSGSHWQSGTPGAVALGLLSAPNGLGLTAFKKFTIDTDPATDADQYLTLAGHDYRTGEYNPFDSVDVSPADKRALLASGPFDLPSGSTVVFCYAMVAARYGEPGQPPQNRDTTDLALRCWWAESVFKRVIGIAEEPAMPGIARQIATLVRGVLRMEDDRRKTGDRAELVDISGRKVMDLAPGPNDVRHLAPGVYFIVPESRRSVRKVVVAR